jgi:hypothetical protein
MGHAPTTFGVTATDVPDWRNFVAVYDGTSELERRVGANWYARAWDFSRMLAETHWHKGPTVRNIGAGTQRRTIQAAGILAVLSQHKSWEVNQMLAIETFKSRGALAGGHFEPVREKCRAIFDGGDPFSFARGPKISAFLACIAAQGKCSDVVVDRHIAHIAFGQILDDRARDRKLRITKSRDGYGSVADALLQAVAFVNERDSEHWAPADFQATVWHAWRQELLGEDRGFRTPEQIDVAS